MNGLSCEAALQHLDFLPMTALRREIPKLKNENTSPLATKQRLEFLGILSLSLQTQRRQQLPGCNPKPS